VQGASPSKRAAVERVDDYRKTVVGSEFGVRADFVLVAYGFDPVPFPEGSSFECGQVTIRDGPRSAAERAWRFRRRRFGPRLESRRSRRARCPKAAAAMNRFLTSRRT
jgi:glutamate synthase (NADPH/NADH) small chain